MDWRVDSSAAAKVAWKAVAEVDVLAEMMVVKLVAGLVSPLAGQWACSVSEWVARTVDWSAYETAAKKGA
jgi:hypothetical protein